jgi:hypothetical protein
MSNAKLTPTPEALRALLENPKVDLPEGYDGAPLGLLDLDLAAAKAWYMSRGVQSLGKADGAVDPTRVRPETIWNNLGADLKLTIVAAIAARRRELAGQ